MPSIPFATPFLVGGVLTLVLPVAVLIALSVWYTLAVRKVPGTDPSELASAADPSPSTAPAAEAPPTPAAGGPAA